MIRMGEYLSCWTILIAAKKPFFQAKQSFRNSLGKVELMPLL